MEEILSVLDELKEMNREYGISTEAVARLLDEMETAKVCVPVIGKFSSGKSALVNALLGYSRKILKEDITPETAVPAEITYSVSDSVTLIKKDGAEEGMSLEAYREYEADYTAVRCARIGLYNSFLEKIPDVKLVDMPGFESGYEVHDRAIDGYLPQSMAYIIAVPADDMIIRSSVGNILKELCLHDMPLCVVITKYDKRNDDFDSTLEKMKESLKRYVGEREIRFCITSSVDGDVEELEEFLIEIQEKSQNILAASYRGRALQLLDNTENYLNTILNGSRLSESELDEKEERLKRQLEELENGFSREQDEFDREIRECTEAIRDDVQIALESEESTFVAMAMNGQSINDQLKNVVRNAVTVSVQKRLIPKVQKHLKRMESCLESEVIRDVNFSFHIDVQKLDKGMTGSIVAAVAGIILGLPILGFVAAFAMKLFGDKKREEARQKVRAKLQNEVFPQVVHEAGKAIDTAVAGQIGAINTSIAEEWKNQKNTLEKAMADVRAGIEKENQHRESLEAGISNDLKRIGDMRDGL